MIEEKVVKWFFFILLNLMKPLYVIFLLLIFSSMPASAQQRYSHIKRVKTEKIETPIEDKSELIEVAPVQYSIVHINSLIPARVEDKLDGEKEGRFETNCVNTSLQIHQKKNIYQVPFQIKKILDKKYAFKLKKPHQLKTAKPAIEMELLAFILILAVGVVLFTIGLFMQLVWMIPIWGIVVTILGSSMISVGTLGLLFN